MNEERNFSLTQARRREKRYVSEPVQTSGRGKSCRGEGEEKWVWNIMALSGAEAFCFRFLAVGLLASLHFEMV